MTKQEEPNYECNRCRKPCSYVVVMLNPHFKERRSGCCRAPLILRPTAEKEAMDNIAWQELNSLTLVATHHNLLAAILTRLDRLEDSPPIMAKPTTDNPLDAETESTAPQSQKSPQSGQPTTTSGSAEQ